MSHLASHKFSTCDARCDMIMLLLNYKLFKKVVNMNQNKNIVIIILSILLVIVSISFIVLYNKEIILQEPIVKTIVEEKIVYISKPEKIIKPTQKQEMKKEEVVVVVKDEIRLNEKYGGPNNYFFL